MEEATKPGSAEDQNVSDSLDTETTETTDTPNKEDKVAYATFQKLLSEKKKLKEKLDKIERQETKRRDDELKAKEDYKSLLEVREKEINDLNQKLTDYTTRESSSRKLESFLDSIGGKIQKKFWVHIPLDKVQINPDTGEVDEMSVTKAVEHFRKEYPELIEKQGASKMPNESPKGGGVNLSYEDWLKLPTNEMKKRLKDIVK